MTQYHSEIDGFASIYPNRYFTAEYGNVDREPLNSVSSTMAVTFRMWTPM